jgi:hypothetical protein
MEEQLRALLVGYAPLTALVAQRIYWNAIPQDTADPCVVLYKVSGAPGYHSEGADDLDASIVQIDVRAISVSSMWAVARAIKAKLSGHKDSDFGGIFLRSERQTSEKPGTVLYHRAMLDFDVWSST